MTANNASKADYQALNNLIVNCPEFEELERLLGGFNIFRVLGFEYGEIRHSNVLGWILDPSESHGLGETFLKKWLMRVIHLASDFESSVEPIDIDSWQLLDVDVRREWKHIDLLLVLRFAQERPWVIAIENKVNSTQRLNQLEDYRQIVEREFADAGHRIYLFLTKNNEDAEDSNYLPASYEEVHHVLQECVAARSHLIGAEPKALLENYIQLLEEKFMDQSKIAQVARAIYKQHRRALQVLFEHSPDNRQILSEGVRSILGDQAATLGIEMTTSGKTHIRFIPLEWKLPGNSHGSAWSNCNHTVLFELKLVGSNPTLQIVSGMAPRPWIDDLWQLTQNPPFKRQKKRSGPGIWVKLHHAGTSEVLIDEEQTEDDSASAQIVDWCQKVLKDQNTQKVIQVIADTLPTLDAHYSTQAS